MKQFRLGSSLPFCWTIVMAVQAIWIAVVWNQSRQSLSMIWSAKTTTTTGSICADDGSPCIIPKPVLKPPRIEIVVTILHDRQQSDQSKSSEVGDWLLLPEVQDIPVTICSPDRLRRRNSTNNISSSFHPEDAFSNILNSNRTGKVTILPMVNGFRAGEAPGYLTYILQNWDSLPDVTIFLHGDPQPHNPNILSDIRRVISGDSKNTSTSWTPEQIGFLHLNLGPVVCRRAEGPPATPDDEWPLQWELMGFDPRSFPGRIKLPCCAQFMVTKERILLRPKWFYQQTLKLIYEFNDGGFLEHIWHIIWGEQAILSDDREVRTYAASKWTKPVHDAVLHKPYINHKPLYLSESMKPWYELYQADPDAYYPIVKADRSACPPGKYTFCYEPWKRYC